MKCCNYSAKPCQATKYKKKLWLFLALLGFLLVFIPSLQTCFQHPRKRDENQIIFHKHNSCLRFLQFKFQCGKFYILVLFSCHLGETILKTKRSNLITRKKGSSASFNLLLTWYLYYSFPIKTWSTWLNINTISGPLKPWDVSKQHWIRQRPDFEALKSWNVRPGTKNPEQTSAIKQS